MSRVMVGLGSNLGDRAARLVRAATALHQHDAIALTNVSSVYETAPWGDTDQPAFLNAALSLTTQLSPEDLLVAVKQIEDQIGRRASRRWGPRAIDIDLLTYEGERRTGDRLTLPHARLLDRAFVLVPLAEIAPDDLIEDRSLQVAIERLNEPAPTQDQSATTRLRGAFVRLQQDPDSDFANP